jgi:hypothetical protein
MRVIRYQLNELVTVLLNGQALALKLRGKAFRAKFHCDIEDAPAERVDLMVWLSLFGMGINHREAGLDVPEFWLTGRRVQGAGGKGAVLGYSAGADSTAALALRAYSTPVMLRRTYCPEYQKSQYRIALKIGAQVVGTNFELIRKEVTGKPHGFNIGIGYAGLLALCAHRFDANEITLGVVWDDLSFFYGDPFVYNSTTCRTSRIMDIMRAAGIDLSYPTAGISEALTTTIASESAFPVSSCHGSANGESGEVVRAGKNACGACYKCLRKFGIAGERISDENAARLWAKIMLKRPIKMAASTIYGIQRGKYAQPYFDRYKDIDVTFCDRYSQEYLRAFCSARTAAIVEQDLMRRGIKPQSQADAIRIARFVDVINDPKLYSTE